MVEHNGNFVDEIGLPFILSLWLCCWKNPSASVLFSFLCSLRQSLEGVLHNHLNDGAYLILSIVVFDWEKHYQAMPN